MAKVIVEIDTEARTMSVSLNGENIDNVRSVNCYAPNIEDEKEYGWKPRLCCIERITEVNEGDVIKWEQICAGENKFSSSLHHSIANLLK